MKHTYICADCGEEICEGDTCYCIGGKYYCKSCIDWYESSAPAPEEG